MRYIIVSMICASMLMADDIDSLLSGFDTTKTSVVQKTKSPLSATYSLYSSYNYSLPTHSPHNGLNSLKNSMDISYDEDINDIKYKANIITYYDLAPSLQNENYTSQYKQASKEWDIKELYVQSSLTNNIDYKIGRQIVTWGKSDNIIVTDILNPLDKSKLGIVDIKELKLGKMMSKIDYYQGNTNISLIVQNEARVSKMPVYGDEYYLGNSDINANKPDSTIENTKLALATNYTGSGYDVSLYLAQSYSDTGYIQNGIREYNSYNMVGFATNYAFGNWLLKCEGGLFDNLKYTNVIDTKQRLDILGGVEYKGFSDTTISLEHVNRKIYNYDPKISLGYEGQKENETQTALRINKDFANSTVHTTILRNLFGTYEDGGFQRANIDYDYRDDLVFSVGFIDYFGEKKQKFNALKDNDKLFAKASWSF